MKSFKYLFIIMFSFFGLLGSKAQTPKSIHSFKVEALDGSTIDFSKFKGKKILIVNTASQCGFTPQYEDLEKLYETYKDKLVIVGFPANNFGGQEPGTNQEIGAFCQKNYGVTFPILAKSEVRGANAQPLYKYLVEQQCFAGLEFLGEKLSGFLKSNLPEFLVGDEVKWNFTKFLIDKQGKVIKRYESMVNPLDIAPDIEKLL